MTPLSRTKILLHILKCHNRLETIIIVLPSAISDKASYNLISLSTSKPVIASSRIITLGFLIKALAIAIFCLSPVDKFVEFSSRKV